MAAESKQPTDLQPEQRKDPSNDTCKEDPCNGPGGWLPSFRGLPSAAQLTIKAIALISLLTTVWFLTRMSATTPYDSVPAAAGLTDSSADQAAEQLALARSRREQALVLGGSVLALLQDLDTSLEDWAKVQELMTNNEGRLLAGNTQFATAIAAMLTTDRPAVAEVTAWRQACQALVDPIEVANRVSRSLYAPGTETFNELTALRESVLKHLNPLRQDLTSIDAMRSTAKRENNPSSITLGEAIARERECSTLQSTQSRADQRAKAESESVARVAQAEADRIRKETEAIAALVESQAKAQELRLRAQRDDIKAKYGPFLDKGRFRPKDGFRGKQTEEPRPMSYSVLKSFGVCDDHRTFAYAGAGVWLWKKYRFPNQLPQQGDRQLWPRPSDEDDLDTYKDRFREFCELAPIWAVDGTLDP